MDPLHPLLRPPRPIVPRSPRPTLMTNGTRSLTHTASPHLLVAPRPPSPSRLTPLELVGVLATSVAVGSAKPPSAPCGGTFDASPSAALGASDRRGFAGGFALGTCMLSRVMSSCWSLWSSSAASWYGGSLWRHRRWRWCGNQFGFSGNLEKLHTPLRFPGYVFARQGSSWWSPSLAKRLHRCRICCSWDVTLLLMGVETVGGVMTKLTERNTTTFMASNPDVHDVR